jgi:membrane associated rhomboid family serine protease
MSWRDRPYSADDDGSEFRLQFRRPSSVVTWLIMANIAVYILELISLNWSRTLFLTTFGLSLNGLRNFCFWQPITYMFVHDPYDVFHIVMNMLGLYIFGSEFERTFGWQRFLQFYTICGVAGAMAYLALSLIVPMPYQILPLVGASGAIFGLLIAATIFFPAIQVVLIIFPMSVRVFALIYAGILLVQMLTGQVRNLGGEVCHVAGAAAGMLVFYAWGMMPRIRVGSGRLGARLEENAWARRQRQASEQQAEVDRILAKIHHQGLGSLTRREKNVLAEATRHQRERESEFGRLHRL